LEGEEMKDWIYRWSPAIVVMILIFMASATPGSDIPKFGIWDTLVKKGGHMCGYALLASAFFYALGKGKRINRTQFIAAIALAFLYACTDEFHQIFTPQRTSSVIDIGIDTAGAAIGLSVWRLVEKLFENVRKKPVASSQ
jgi:VanZ family protein